MGLSENSDDHIQKLYKDLCNNLNMDSATTTLAWDSYESISQHYSLEGEPLHWLGCAIYVACRKSSAPTVGETGAIVKGNCVSLTRLLRLCKFSLKNFFLKSKQWADMANMPEEFRKKIDDLERNFAVSILIFIKYQKIFNDLFLTPVDDQPKQHRSRKQKNLPCTPSRVFEFCWSLFVYIKGEYIMCSDDIVTSYHLLLACCDMAFGVAVLADRRDLLNPSFEGLPSNWSSPDYVKPTTAPCIINLLCNKHIGVAIDAQYAKEYSWKGAMQKLYEKGTLQGNFTNYSDLFDVQNFEQNMKSVNKVYEEYVLNIGEIDEKIFLAEYRRLQLINKHAANGIRSPLLNTDGESDAQIKRNLENKYDDQIQQLVPATPLTGRKYLRGSKDFQKNAPLITATQSVIRLHNLLAGRQPEPSAELREIFSKCVRDPTAAIKNRIEELSKKFKADYSQQASDQPNSNLNFVNKRVALSEILYYKLLENVVQEERQRNPNLDITILLEQDIFHRCMFGCSIEIVIYSYNCQRKFPWILEALDLKAYYFYRVIELIVRTKDQLSRDVVKHLNSIEEQILDSIAWESNSPLWQCIEENRPIPSCEDTALPGQLETNTQISTNSNLRKVSTIPTTIQSPVTTATERFQSPIANSLVKKQLFVDPHSSKITPGKSILQKQPTYVLVVENGTNKLIPMSDVNRAESTSSNSNNTALLVPKTEPVVKPRRNGSLALFFRKFYNLAGIRMEELCNQLGVTDLDLKRKIFTCIEHSIIEHTELMKDRHLDQILMCAVYVVCKVTRNEKTFTEIMKCYREQPQADSHIYRSVLMYKRTLQEAEIDRKPVIGIDKECLVKRNPNELSGTSTTHDLEDRGDLIKFYNTVYIQLIQNFALKFSNTQQVDLHLSPLPASKHLVPSSPKRRVTDNIYVRPYGQILSSPNNQVRQLSYLFSRSPSKDLKNINNAISSHGVGKRLLSGENDDDDVIPRKKPTLAMTRKLQGLIEERLVQAKE